MVENIGAETGESHGLLVSDKVDIMALVCKRLSQFSCQYATSAKGWVTNDTYIHLVLIGGYEVNHCVIDNIPYFFSGRA
jgi:hypothetical protein